MNAKTQASADFMTAINEAIEAHYRYLGLTPEQEKTVERYGHFAHSEIADKVAVLINNFLVDGDLDTFN